MRCIILHLKTPSEFKVKCAGNCLNMNELILLLPNEGELLTNNYSESISKVSTIKYV